MSTKNLTKKVAQDRLNTLLNDMDYSIVNALKEIPIELLVERARCPKGPVTTVAAFHDAIGAFVAYLRANYGPVRHGVTVWEPVGAGHNFDVGRCSGQGGAHG